MSFQFDFTLDKFKKVLPNPTPEKWYQAVYDNLPKYEIDTKSRVAAWVAQIGHESGDLRYVVENLNYSAERLVQVFPIYFPDLESAEPFSYQPEKLANRIYSNRNGNGDEASGDGWKFRGRGAIQVTGRANYTNCSTTMYGDLVLLDTPDLLMETDGAIRSACWYWNSRGLNGLADHADMKEITRRINGGYNGLEDRMARYNRALGIL